MINIFCPSFVLYVILNSRACRIILMECLCAVIGSFIPMQRSPALSLLACSVPLHADGEAAGARLKEIVAAQSICAYCH